MQLTEIHINLRGYISEVCLISQFQYPIFMYL